MDWWTQLQVIGEVALAIVLGGVVGFERELANKPAGFRTHMLVAGSAALLVGLSDALIQRFGENAYGVPISSDPMRIVSAIITGISFLGAGTIFRDKAHIEGLTTAASLLLSGAVGMAVALHQFVIAGGITLLTLVVLRGVKFIEDRIKSELK